MKTISEYTIYCTEAQTKKALELGAQIKIAKTLRELIGIKYIHIKGEPKALIIPTAEQMIGWLRKEHKIHPRIDCEGAKNYVVQLQFINSSKNIDIENRNYKGIIGHKGYPSVPEATLAAIDAALEYLSNNK